MATLNPRNAVVIEDDADIRNLLEAILGEAGFSCQTADSGLTGIEAVRTHQPILTTLDVSLPGIDGFEVARRIRAFSDTYIIMLSARDEEIDTLMGLDAGADDYLTKPFRPRELRARVEAMLRRYPKVSDEASGDHATAGNADSQAARTESAAETKLDEDLSASEEGWLSHNGLRVNIDMRLCEIDGVVLELTRSEFELLVAIMLGRRRVISKNSLALDMRGEDGAGGGYVSESDKRAVEVHLANLRRKLNDSVNAPRFIETVRGVGYRLATRQQDAAPSGR
jgi:DNA-binding response OmpR family regulator